MVGAENITPQVAVVPPTVIPLQIMKTRMIEILNVLFSKLLIAIIYYHYNPPTNKQNNQHYKYISYYVTD